MRVSRAEVFHKEYDNTRPIRARGNPSQLYKREFPATKAEYCREYGCRKKNWRRCFLCPAPKRHNRRKTLCDPADTSAARSHFCLPDILILCAPSPMAGTTGGKTSPDPQKMTRDKPQNIFQSAGASKPASR